MSCTGEIGSVPHEVTNIIGEMSIGIVSHNALLDVVGHPPDKTERPRPIE